MARDSFLAIGECMVEMAPEADGRYVMGFAGDTLNTAWYARRLLPATGPGGWRVGYLSAVGTDAISNRMLRFIEDAGIDTAHVARRADRSVGLYLIELDRGERSFAYWRASSAARTLAEDGAALAAALAGARLAYVSGITLAILAEADRARLLAALAEARRAGCTVAFDPNLRPRLWPDSAAMCAAVSAAAAHADIVLPSYQDEAAHFGDPDPEATARRYGAAGARLVVVKDGPEAITTLADGTLARHPAVAAASVVDTTAAGDSFNAGFLAAHLGAASLAEAVAAGAGLAARVIGQRGALVEAG